MHSKFRLGLAAVCLLAAGPALAGFSGTDLFLPNVGRQAGMFPSNWYTTVWVYNPGTEAATARIYLLARNTANPSPPSVDVLVPPGDTVKLDNAVESLFHVQVFGALRVTCDSQKLVVTSRTYSKGAGAGEKDSVGQDFAGVPASFAIGAGEKTQVLGVHQTLPAALSDYRFNFGFVETTGHQATVRVSAFDGNGQLQGSEDLNVREYSQRQVAFKDHFPAVSTEDVRLEMEVISGTGKIIAYGSGIANASQDPTTFEMTTELPALVHDATLAGAGTTASPLGIAPGTSPGQVLTTVSAGAVPPGQASTLAAGVSVAWQSPVAQPPSGPAGGALSGAYPNPGIAAGQAVRSLNGLKDEVTLAAAGAVTITPSGNTLTIGSTGLVLPFSGSASAAVSALAVTNNGTGAAVTGSAPNANGVVGSSSADGFAAVAGSNPIGYGVYGAANNTGYAGVLGSNSSGPGVVGTSTVGSGVSGSSTSGRGVNGYSLTNIGVYGDSNTGNGVFGRSDSSYGVWGASNGSSGVYGQSSSGEGVYGDSNVVGVKGFSSTGTGVRGTSAYGNGVIGESSAYGYAAVSGSNPNGYGIYGVVTNSGYAGVYGSNSTGAGVSGLSSSGNGLYGRSNGASAGGSGGNGVYGYSPGGVGVAGFSDAGYGVKCYGNGGYTGSWSNLSDERLKKDVSPLASALDRVLALRGVSFTWRRDEFPEQHLNAGQQIGFIAQEVEPVLPEVVSSDPQGYLTIDYSKLTPVLVEAIKAQQAVIERHEGAEAELRTALSSLTAEVRRLRAEVEGLPGGSAPHER